MFQKTPAVLQFLPQTLRKLDLIFLQKEKRKESIDCDGLVSTTKPSAYTQLKKIHFSRPCGIQFKTRVKISMFINRVLSLDSIEVATAQARFRCRVGPYEVCGGQNCIFFPEDFGFPCKCYSADDEYSYFIQRPLTPS
jgi:hypothetical protein